MGDDLHKVRVKLDSVNEALLDIQQLSKSVDIETLRLLVKQEKKLIEQEKTLYAERNLLVNAQIAELIELLKQERKLIEQEKTLYAERNLLVNAQIAKVEAQNNNYVEALLGELTDYISHFFGKRKLE